jgi:hypothetical protein
MTPKQEARVQRALEQRAHRTARRVTEQIVKVVNRRTPNKLLLDFVQTWIAAGYRLNKWARRDSFKEETRYRTFSLYQSSEADPVKFEAHWGYPYPPAQQSSITDVSETGGDDWEGYQPPPEEGYEGYEQWIEEREEANPIAQEAMRESIERPEMLTLFFQLLTGPYYDKIGRCPRCGRFFVKGRSDQTFCTQRCASAVTAKKAVYEARKREHQDKLKRVEEEWDRFGTRTSERKVKARDWISKRTGLSRTFVTRALHELGKV